MTAREVELNGGAPWGFRMHGGADHNQPLRISRVNPGRKASLSGIREGDVISSINGRPTRGLSNAEAHAILRSAGPLLRLGLNEDKEVSPRRRSIGKGTELKRPSQLVTDGQSGRATPQAPVYATIRPSNSSLNKSSSSPLRSSHNSLSSDLNSTNLVRSVINDDTPRFHPTNPFYTTLPPNHLSASKLPIPNGKTPLSGLDRSRIFNKSRDTLYFNECSSDLKSPSYFTKHCDSGSSSIPQNLETGKQNGAGSGFNYVASEKSDIVYNKFSERENFKNGIDQKTQNPFKTNCVKNDPFEKYLNTDGNLKNDTERIPNSLSEGYFNTRKEIQKSSTITEHKISEIEEVKTIKKIVLNGSRDDYIHNTSQNSSSIKDQNHPGYESKVHFEIPIQVETPERGDMFNGGNRNNSAQGKNREEFYFSPNYQSSPEEFKPTAEAPPPEVVVTKPPPSSPTTSTIVREPSPTPKPVWRPGASSPVAPAPAPARSPAPPPPPPPPVWTPASAGPSPQSLRKTFRPVHFEETPPARRKFGGLEQNGCTSGSDSEGRLRTSQSAPATGLNSLGASPSASRLPKAQNPTVTLLQKARESQLSRGNYSYQQQQERDNARLPRDRASPPKGDPVHALRREYASEGEAERSEYERVGRKMADAHKKLEGIGPITKEGMPVALRSEVKDPSKWYKRMYDTIHKNKNDEEYLTIRYKNRRGEGPQRITSNKSQYAYFDPRSGYLSEPEGGGRLTASALSDAYDSDTTGPRRRTISMQDRRHEEVTSPYLPSNKYSTLASARASQEVYKNQPGRIEDYVPGKSSVVDKETKQWWDEVMDIFDGWLDDNSPLPPYSTLLARALQKNQISSTTSLPQASPKEKKDLTSTILSKSNMARALKESGYESDSTLVFRRREEVDGPLSPAERRAAYRDLQAGGEPPLRGFRSPAPPRTDEDTEIEYIPISSTLTKIRVHKKTPSLHEVICYPVTNIETDLRKVYNQKVPSFINANLIPYDYQPPAPPRRISSRNSRTLKLVTSTKPASPKRCASVPRIQSNVDFLKDKINNKLVRQNTQILSKPTQPESKTVTSTKIRVMSSSAPPAINRKTLLQSKSNLKKISDDPKLIGTSSFGSARKTLLPTQYSNSILSKYGESHVSIPIEGGAGRRTPITNILDKMTSLDKMWSTEKRNERIDLSKLKAKSANKYNNSKVNSNRSLASPTKSVLRGRDMVRTAEKVQKIKINNTCAKSNPCLSSKIETKSQSTKLQASSNISKSSSCLSNIKKINQIKTASVTNLKKKSFSGSGTIRPKSNPCHEICNKTLKELPKNTKKLSKPKGNRKFLQNRDNDSESSSQFGDIQNQISNTESFKDFKRRTITDREIKETRDAVISDSFFQNLFLGGPHSPLIAYPVFEQDSSVLQKAKMFQSYPQEYNCTKSLNSYLIHRKPVSSSRFKMWDRFPSPTNVSSLRSISWPGRMHNKIKKFDSLLKHDEFGSNSSLTTTRSASEPPVNKMYFSQTSRPKSPTVVFYRKDKDNIEQRKRLNSPTKIVFSQTSRPVSPKLLHKSFRPEIKLPTSRHESLSPPRILKTTDSARLFPPMFSKQSKEEQRNLAPSVLFFSQTSRPVSPKINKKPSNVSRSQSTSPISLRSPSYRRIHNVRLQQNKQLKEASSKVLRTRSAGDVDKKNIKNNIDKAYSHSDLPSIDPEYEEYIDDIENNKNRSERFRELNKYYTYLERVGELEKATSNLDLRHRKKDEEIIDFDRWKKIRAIERAEEELNNLYRKLKIAQNENDVLFYPRDIKDFRWTYDRDRGLRTKEKSVEDLKEHFQQTPMYDSLEMDDSNISKGTYKPLWRGTSVAETAFNINRKNENTDRAQKIGIRPTMNLTTESFTDLRKKIGLGNRLWSSLSLEQVNALKTQLNAIYSKELESKKDEDHYAIEVHDTMVNKNPSLHVRSNSLNYLTPKNVQDTVSKSESIAALTSPITSVTTVKELKNNVNKMQMNLSENEKRKISQTLSNEILKRITKLDNTAPLSLKQELEISEGKVQITQEGEENVKEKHEFTPEKTAETNEDTTWNDKWHDNLPIKRDENLLPSSASETETASSDISNKTIIYKEPIKEVQKKIEYFESVKITGNQTKTVYHAREGSDEKEKQISMQPITSKGDCNKLESQKKVQSQSCANLKELFGEVDKNKFLSLPPKPELRSRSPSPYSNVCVTRVRTPDTLRYSSDETIWRSRSPSPEPERYWRAFLTLARAGEVRRLARRFDSPTAYTPMLKRHSSDPEISRNDFQDTWSSFENLSSPRSKKNNMLPVARVPLRPTNRFMPHIDIISKLAALRRRSSPRSRSVEDAPECRSGEVDRIRRRFETMSLLGQIYASAPDMSELRDIAPYLAGPWIAHRYPKLSDNNRSVQEPKVLLSTSTLPVKKVKEKKKAFPKEPVKLSSILKHDTLAKKEFDPSVHRPASRYEPPRAPPRPPPASWPHRLAPFINASRHSVKFQETDPAPEPPRRGPSGSYSDTESPRRYVESDVNIHYKCPVRHDPLPLVPERELARQQAEHMKRLYREQKRNKYLQENDILPTDIEAFDASIKELQDMQNRRHQDNFTPAQKAVVPLNRYDEAEKVVARALFTFNGQTSKELSFKKGDMIHVRRQIDSNWYEGELHGRIGLFPYNYAEILKGDSTHSPKKPNTVEGRAKAKFDFTAQTNLELPLKKGEVVVLTRRIDQNWWEGRNGNKTGIFPDSYITVLQEPSLNKPEVIQTNAKPCASPAAHGMMNGSARVSMGSHRYMPQHNSQALSNAPPATQPLPGYTAQPSRGSLTPSERGYGPPTTPGVDLNNSAPLYVDTNAEAVPYRAMYKYRPQNPDELELNEGDTVYVLEKCDDGWYVGSSQRTGRFGTFPGNYVERI